MWKTSVHPAFSDIDALAHINNCRLPVWFELAREPVFALFDPNLNLRTLPLIIARISVDYIAQMKFGSDIEMHTYIRKIGRSSVTVYQEAYQNSIFAAKGESVLVHFDYATNKAKEIPEDVVKKLTKHLLDVSHPNLKTRSGRLPAATT